MKPVKLIIISIFGLSAVLSYLLYQQKSQRVETQLNKRALGWNPVAIRKMKVSAPGKDTLTFAKHQGIWQSNARFDGMGTANQLLIYLSTMQITEGNARIPEDAFAKPLGFSTFDKEGKPINRLVLGTNLPDGSVYALLNDSPKPVILSSAQNNLSLRALLETGF